MTFATLEQRRAYSKAHYEANKHSYNPRRERLRMEAQIAKAIEQTKEKARAEKQKAKDAAKALKAAEKERVAASRLRKKIPVTLEGQLAVLIREHFANALPANKNNRINGRGLPLSAWMLGAPPGSKIMGVLGNRSRYPYTTYKASSEVLADRIAKRYGITLVQKSLLYEHVNRKYRGQAERWKLGVLIGTESTGPIYGESDFLYSHCISRVRWACDRYGLDARDIPLRAILDERITNILLLIQLNELLRLKK